MNIGMLWFDNDPKATLPAKIAKARDYYATKYLRAPDTCFVHPSMVPPDGEATVIEGVRLHGSHSVLPNHFWLGMEAQHE